MTYVEQHPPRSARRSKIYGESADAGILQSMRVTPTEGCKGTPVKPPIVVLFMVDPEYQSHFDEAKLRLGAKGADVVTLMEGPLDDPGNMRAILSMALKE